MKPTVGSKPVERRSSKRVDTPIVDVVRANLATTTHPSREQLISEAAYHRAEARGFEPGHEVEDWLAAEAEVDERLQGEGRAF